jgi:predicted nuclease of restriction endonuclease-like RecB superfamily
MLTLDLLRYRVDGDSVTPVYLSTSGCGKYRDLAQQLVEMHRSCLGSTVGDLEARLEDTFGSVPDYKVYRGLAKVMAAYLETSPPVEVDAEDLRMRVFAEAAREAPLVRKTDLLHTLSAADKAEDIAAGMGMTRDELLTALYSDLDENRVITSVDSSVTGLELLERYNTALAQAMLYRATRMIIDVADSYRTVFKYIKLARLMHTITPRDKGYRIAVDGPLSLFSSVERYGVNMARLLPAVLKCEDWRLAAKVNLGDSERLFRLSPRTGLKSHYRDEPQFDSSAEEAFFTKFKRNRKCKWSVEREGAVLDLKETVMIPDFKFTHQDGRVVHLEIVGFWTPEYLQKKMEKLSRVSERNIVVAVPESMNCSNDDFTGCVIRYKHRLLIKDVLPALDAVS